MYRKELIKRSCGCVINIKFISYKLVIERKKFV